MSGFLAGLVQRGASVVAGAADAPVPAARDAAGASAYALEAPAEASDAGPAIAPAATMPGLLARVDMSPAGIRVPESAPALPPVADPHESSRTEAPAVPHSSPMAPTMAADSAPLAAGEPRRVAPAPEPDRNLVPPVFPIVMIHSTSRIEEPLAAPTPHDARGSADAASAVVPPPAESSALSAPELVVQLPEARLAPASPPTREFPRGLAAAAPAPQEPAPIHVRIGKVEVRAPPAAAAPAAPARPNAPRAQGFAAYRRLRTYRTSP